MMSLRKWHNDANPLKLVAASSSCNKMPFKFGFHQIWLSKCRWVMVPCSPLLSEPSNGKWLFKWQVMHRLLIPSPGPQSWQGRLGKCLCWWGFVVRYGKIKGWHGRIRQLVFVASCHPGSIAVALRSLGAGYCGQPVLWRSPWVLRCSEPLADHFATAPTE